LASIGAQDSYYGDYVVNLGSPYANKPALQANSSSIDPTIYVYNYGSGASINAFATTGPVFQSVSTDTGGICFHAVPSEGAAAFVARPTVSLPSSTTVGTTAFVYTTSGVPGNRTATPRWVYSDGTNWRFVSSDAIFTG
jgi:hypothetical protein